MDILNDENLEIKSKSSDTDLNKNTKGNFILSMALNFIKSNPKILIAIILHTCFFIYGVASFILYLISLFN